MNLSEAAVTRLAGLRPRPSNRSKGHKPRPRPLCYGSAGLRSDQIICRKRPASERSVPAPPHTLSRRRLLPLRTTLEDRGIAPDDFGLFCAEVLGDVRAARGVSLPDITALTTQEIGGDSSPIALAPSARGASENRRSAKAGFEVGPLGRHDQCVFARRRASSRSSVSDRPPRAACLYKPMAPALPPRPPETRPPRRR